MVSSSIPDPSGFYRLCIDVPLGGCRVGFSRNWWHGGLIRVNFRFAPCGLVTLTVLTQTFKNGHFPPIVCYGFPILLPAGSKMEKQTIWIKLETESKMEKP
ncbi:hypothetical protein Hanom_Chr02g00160011 [Helianthus anomalus]